VEAVQKVFPQALIQFEDFATENAFRLLERYRNRVCCFNDDIQGTAAVTLAGLVSAGRMIGRPLTEQTVLFLGAGAAATGIADLVVASMAREGVDPDAARRRCWFVDSKGLVVSSRSDLAAHKRPYAHEREFAPDLLAAVRAIRPTALIGASGQPQSFTEEVLRAMAAVNDRPIVFALSNPTSKAECTAEQAYRWTEGRAVFASGSPFDPVTLDGRTFVPGQGNNAYIFPGVGLGAVAVKARRVTDEMFAAAAAALAELVTDAELAQGSLFPPLTSIRDVSAAIAARVAAVAFEQDVAGIPRPPDLAGHVRALMYDPRY
jgi:malate dehydrogenase (oxaloacetate-decarboxylating)(NADP+)